MNETSKDNSATNKAMAYKSCALLEHLIQGKFTFSSVGVMKVFYISQE